MSDGPYPAAPVATRVDGAAPLAHVVRCIYRREHAFVFSPERGDEIYFACPGGAFYVCARHARRYDEITRVGGVWDRRFGRARLIELRSIMSGYGRT